MRREHRVRSQQRILQLSLCFSLACADGDEGDVETERDGGSEDSPDEDASDLPEPSEHEGADASVNDEMDAALDMAVDAAFDASMDAAVDAGRDAALDVAALFGCVNRKNNTPDTLECTGLYLNLSTKQVSPDVREFRPAATLWSNGADKVRWIYLPPGTTIDASDPREWVFPVGTKFWKEFRVGGRRIETRFLNKIGSGNWLRGAYRWADDELSAVRYDSSTTEVFQTADGTQYHIPTPVQCDDCHNGRRDFVMGFESILLGLDGAGGITLERLANEGLLAPKPAVTHYTLATMDGGSADSVKALAWLHTNCGVSCHNANPKSKGASFDLHLRLDPDQLALQTAPDNSWDVLGSTVNVAGKSKTGAGSVRIVPHQPDASLLVKVISGSPTMPYLDTVQVNYPDTSAVTFIRSWISSMPANPSDGASDGGSAEAGSADAGTGADAAVAPRDGGRPTPDAGLPASDASDTSEAGDADATSDSGCEDADADGGCLF